MPPEKLAQKMYRLRQRLKTFLEKEEGIWKVSVRTGSRADASVLCGKFGGGGHARASGCLIRAGYDEAVRMLTEAAEQLLEPLE